MVVKQCALLTLLLQRRAVRAFDVQNMNESARPVARCLAAECFRVGFDHPSFCLQVLRDGKWSEQDAVILVPGDIISIKLGDIVPADARLLEGDPLKIDQVQFVFREAFVSTLR